MIISIFGILVLLLEMAFKTQRHSKYRHIFFDNPKPAICYQNVKFAAGGVLESSVCDVSGKFIAVIFDSQGGGGGSIMVLKHGSSGRVALDHPKIQCHSLPVADLKFSPFDDYILASCSEDCTLKIWKIPEGGMTEEIKVPLFTCSSLKKITGIAWHPTVKNIIASICGLTVLQIWNIEKEETLMELDITQHIHSIAWNYYGSLLGVTSKDKMLRIIDPRADGNQVINQTQFMEGTKGSRCCFTGTQNFIVTTGFSRSAERDVSLWDLKTMKLVSKMELDTNNAILYTLYDPDTGVLTVVGKGDSSIRFYEVFPEPPHFQFLNILTSQESFKGFGFLPKADVDIMSCEIIVLYKLAEKGDVKPIKIRVPRKSTAFQDDIYDTFEAKIPSQTIEDWWINKKTSGPMVQKFVPLGVPIPEPYAHTATAPAISSNTTSTKTVTGANFSSGTISLDEYNKLKQENENLTAENGKFKAKNNELEKELLDLKEEVETLKQN